MSNIKITATSADEFTKVSDFLKTLPAKFTEQLESAIWNKITSYRLFVSNGSLRDGVIFIPSGFYSFSIHEGGSEFFYKEYTVLVPPKIDIKKYMILN